MRPKTCTHANTHAHVLKTTFCCRPGLPSTLLPFLFAPAAALGRRPPRQAAPSANAAELFLVSLRHSCWGRLVLCCIRRTASAPELETLQVQQLLVCHRTAAQLLQAP